jgi:hypothetical protein
MSSKAVYAAVRLKMAFSWSSNTEVKVKFLYFVSRKETVPIWHQILGPQDD